jgi:hypothetical protein
VLAVEKQGFAGVRNARQKPGASNPLTALCVEIPSHRLESVLPVKFNHLLTQVYVPGLIMKVHCVKGCEE